MNPICISLFYYFNTYCFILKPHVLYACDSCETVWQWKNEEVTEPQIEWHFHANFKKKNKLRLWIMYSLHYALWKGLMYKDLFARIPYWTFLPRDNESKKMWAPQKRMPEEKYTQQTNSLNLCKMSIRKEISKKWDCSNRWETEKKKPDIKICQKEA